MDNEIESLRDEVERTWKRQAPLFKGAIAEIAVRSYLSKKLEKYHCVVVRKSPCYYDHPNEHRVKASIVGALLFPYKESFEYLEKTQHGEWKGALHRDIPLLPCKPKFRLVKKKIKSHFLFLNGLEGWAERDVEWERDVICIDISRCPRGARLLLQKISGGELCSDDPSVVDKLVRGLRNSDICIVEWGEFEVLVEDIFCLLKCFKENGKSCLDYLLVAVENRKVAKGYLVEVKVNWEDARKMRAVRNKCEQVCKPRLVRPILFYLKLGMSVSFEDAKVWGL